MNGKGQCEVSLVVEEEMTKNDTVTRGRTCSGDIVPGDWTFTGALGQGTLGI